MEYKQEQKTQINRHINSIEAAKIVNIDKNSMTIERFNGQTLNFPVSDIIDYKTNDYVDIQYFKSGGSGYTLKLIGHTPPAFIPDKNK